jgi:hypothetical protein
MAGRRGGRFQARLTRLLVGVALAIGTTTATGISIAAAADLRMGFGIQTGSQNRLQLDSAANWPTVNGYLNAERATWVSVGLDWCFIAQGQVLAQLRGWADRAIGRGKNVLMTIGYNAPVGIRKSGNTCSDGNKLPQRDNAALNSMRDAAHDVWRVFHGDAAGNYPGGGIDRTGSLMLEVGNETNLSGEQGDHYPVYKSDARFFWDAVNRVAYFSGTYGWPFGKGVVAGGVYTGTPPGSGEWGTGSVNAHDYLVEAIAGSRAADGWWHSNQTYFGAYGIHAAHCGGGSDRTRWSCGTNPNKGIFQRVSWVRSALVDTGEPPGKALRITALLPTSAPMGVTQEIQATDTTGVWDGLRTTYATYANYTLDLVVWNHLVDTGQVNFPTTGFMQCEGGGTFPCWPYEGKQVYTTAQGWDHAIP